MALALYPLDATHTRLVWRIRNAPYRWTSGFIIAQLFADGVDVIAVRENLLGIKRRAEKVPLQAPGILYLELVLWLSVFVQFLVAEAGLIVRRDWTRPLVAVPASALVTVGLVLMKPPVWLDGLATVAVGAGLWWIYRRNERPRVA